MHGEAGKDAVFNLLARTDSRTSSWLLATRSAEAISCLCQSCPDAARGGCQDYAAGGLQRRVYIVYAS
jgi:hypothetical protein